MRCSVQCDDTLTQDEQDLAHSSVRVDVLCVAGSHGCRVVIGVGRATSCNVTTQTYHTNIEFSLLYFQSNCALVVGLYVVIVNSFL